MISLEERKQRRERVIESIRKAAAGESAIALLQGAPKESTHSRFRQYNDMHYLCDIATPHAYLALDARDGASRLFLPYQTPDHRKHEGALLSAADPAEARRHTGVDEVHPLDQLAAYLEKVTAVFTPLRAGEGAVSSWDTLQRGAQERLSDPWDGRPDRYRWFVQRLRERCPRAEIQDLAPILDELRLIKSASEIALLRVSGELSAKGLVEAMRCTRPGEYEYRLDAAMRFVYLRGGALDVAYRAIVAGGDNAWYGHYNANDAELKDGDMVLVDCGPDYHYYASDITRMWPVNGVYSPVQRELYGFMLRYHVALLERLKAGVSAEQVQEDAAAEMAEVVEATRFSKPIYEQAARRALVFPHHLSHPVGLAVHDVGSYRGKPLREGLVLTVDPQLIIPEERLYVRVEDTVVITADGVENFTEFAPLEMDDVEAVMAGGSWDGPAGSVRPS